RLGKRSVLEAHNRDELAGSLRISEQFSRKIALCPGLLVALPVLVQCNNGILFACLGPVDGNGDKHLCTPLLCQERKLLATGYRGHPNPHRHSFDNGSIPVLSHPDIGETSHFFRAPSNGEKGPRYGRNLLYARGVSVTMR